MTTYFTTRKTPLGTFTLSSDGHALTGLYPPRHNTVNPRPPHWVEDDSPFGDACEQLRAYWEGDLREFTVRLAPGGTTFQNEVWNGLKTIPYGQTMTYGELARRLGRPLAARAVGAANGRNPISILIPCHRLIGANKSPTGYAGGLDAKRWLLAHEGAV